MNVSRYSNKFRGLLLFTSVLLTRGNRLQDTPELLGEGEGKTVTDVIWGVRLEIDFRISKVHLEKCLYKTLKIIYH